MPAGENILSVIQSAEDDYAAALETAAERGAAYAEERRAASRARIDEMRRKHREFETSERDRLEREIAGRRRAMEAENEESKALLRERMEQKAGALSDRLAEEVLAEYGDS